MTRPASPLLWLAVSRGVAPGLRWLSLHDLFSRRVVGWKLDQRMDAAPVIEALNRVLDHRQVERERLLFHDGLAHLMV